MQAFVNKLKQAYDTQNFSNVRKLVEENADYILDNETLILKCIDLNECFITHLHCILEINKKFLKLSNDFHKSSGISFSQDSIRDGNVEYKLNKFKEYLTFKNQFLLQQFKELER